MRAVTVGQMREIERRAAEEYDVSGEELMDRAGHGVAEATAQFAEDMGVERPSILVCAGRGNNGGDALVVARYLRSWDFPVTVWLAGRKNQMTGDAAKHLSLYEAADGKVEELPTVEDWQEELDFETPADLIVDGLLGTGSRGPARGPIAAAIDYINARRVQLPVVAIDVPSGLDADTGRAAGDAVRADLTACIGLPKIGLLEDGARDYVGGLEMVNLGLPDELTLAHRDPDGAAVSLLERTEIRDGLPPRPRTAHKGHYGHLLLVAGARGYAGAAMLAARAAVRSGAGLVTLLTPESLAPVVSVACWEAMVRGGPETAAGSLAADALRAVADRWADFTALAVGPGLTVSPDTEALLRALLARAEERPVLLDADALNLAARAPDMLSLVRGPLVLTPHPGEMGRLLGTTAEAVQADRRGAARRLAEKTGARVVLKGAGTLLAGAPDEPLRINLTGNPGMASGGMGDVLTGLMGGLLAQPGLPPMTAAATAVYLHGAAGDKAAARCGHLGVTAGMVEDALPDVMTRIWPR